MEYNELCRELSRLQKDGSPDPNPDLLTWITNAEHKLAEVKAKFEGKSVKSKEANHTGEEIAMEDGGLARLKTWFNPRFLMKCLSQARTNAIFDFPTRNSSLQRLRELQREKQTLLKELSEHAGRKLTTNNSGIANLGDENRPSRITEKFSEVYDNLWTDAMETLDSKGFDEKDSIEFLLDVLKNIHQFSMKLKESRLQLFISLALGLNSNGGCTEDVYENINFKTKVNVDIPEDMKIQCSRYLSYKDRLLPKEKTIQEQLQKELQNYFRDQRRKTALTLKAVANYIESCFELCWAMCSQSPPVVMVTDTNDVELYRSYTKSGDVIDYVVWPSLLLHENGPLLYKGVAQLTSSNIEHNAMYENV